MLKFSITLLLLICIAVPQSASQAFVQGDQPSQFKLSIEKTTYYVAEPVELAVKLYNDQPKAIKGQFDLALTKQVEVYHRKVGGQFVRYLPYWVKSISRWFTAPPQSEIPAHGNTEDRMKLLYNSSINQFVLPEPGEYEFQAKFVLPSPLNNRLYESNIVRVKVVDPGEKEQAALAALKDPQLGALVEGDLRTVFVGNEKVESGAEKAAAFLENYSSSFYAPLVQEQLMVVLSEASSRKEKFTSKLQAIYNWLKPIYNAQHPE